jgi:hypothetical protein
MQNGFSAPAANPVIDTSSIAVSAPQITVAVKITLAPGRDALPDDASKVLVPVPAMFAVAIGAVGA